jgi:hypothetical protein
LLTVIANFEKSGFSDYTATRPVLFNAIQSAANGEKIRFEAVQFIFDDNVDWWTFYPSRLLTITLLAANSLDEFIAIQKTTQIIQASVHYHQLFKWFAIAAFLLFVVPLAYAYFRSHAEK